MGAIWRRTWGGVLALTSGILLVLCFPPFDAGGLVWVGMIPLMVALWAGGGEKRRWWYGFRMGWMAGAVFWVINLKWIAEVSDLGMWAVGFYLAVYFGFWGSFAAGVGNPWLRKDDDARPPLSVGARSLSFAAVNGLTWCGLEWVRGWMLTGFGWNGLGVSFHQTPVIAQAADLVGVTGLSFLPVFLAAVLVQVGRRLHSEARRGRLRAHWDFGIAASVIAVVFVYGVVRLQRGIGGEVRPLKVLLVQLNIPQDAKTVLWSLEEVHRGYEEETLKAFEALEERNAGRVEEALNDERPEAGVTLDLPDWVVWPEAALKQWLFFTEDGTQATGEFNRQTIGIVREQAPFTLMMGLNEIEGVEDNGRLIPKEEPATYNSLLVLPEGEEQFLSYRKHHLVIFGETIPYVEQLTFLAWLFEKSAGVKYTGSFDVGTGHDPLLVPHRGFDDGAVAIIPSICFEDTVPRLVRKFAVNGGQVIVNVTNDGWFKESEAAAQHFANARFRCIELRRPMVRCSNTGVSAVVGVTGSVGDPVTGEARVLVDEDGNHLTRGWLFATVHVPVDGPLTLYARWGDWFSAWGLAIGFAWSVTGRLRRG
jgi:apolipoprotein N-acyltransferase